MKKGISIVIASILMLMIVIGLGSTTYLFISGTLSSKTSTAFSIIDSVGDTILIRNEGTDPIKSFHLNIGESRNSYFLDNFDDGNCNGWLVKNGKWSAATGELASVDPNSKISLPDIDFGNFVLEVKGKGFVGIVFRVMSQSDYYLFNKDDDKKVSLYKFVSNRKTILQSVDYDVSDQSKKYNYEITASGDSIKIFIDGNLVINAIGNEPTLRSGRIWFQTGELSGSFDDVKINPLVLPGNTGDLKIYDALPSGRQTVKLCTSSMCNTGYVEIGRVGLVVEKIQQQQLPNPQGKVLTLLNLRNTGNTRIHYIDIAVFVASEITTCNAGWSYIGPQELKDCEITCAVGEEIKIITSKSENTAVC